MKKIKAHIRPEANGYEFFCPECKAQFWLPWAGDLKAVKCPGCGERFEIRTRNDQR